ncbi:MAG: hypothetical protein GXO71_05340 [Caldiserica bacterium]|nr:hypothetical protein [Caldisericota bacterium]
MSKILLFYLGGLLLIFLELYLPGGILGTIGSVLIVVSMVYAYRIRIIPQQAPLIIAFQILLGGILIYIWIKQFHRTRWGKRLILEENEDVSKGYVAQEKELENLVGKEGITLTLLRPVGIAEVEGKRVGVVTEGIYVGKGKKVRVLEVSGNRLKVKEIEEDA